MTRFRFIHAADLHLDTPFQGIGRTAPHVADALRDASLDAWDALVNLAIDREVAFLLLAGDVYDGPERGVRAQLRFVRGLEALAAHSIETFIVYGNHDPLDGWSAIRRWPPGVVIFPGDTVQSAPVERDGARLATIHGISYPRRDVTENLALRFTRGPEPGLHVGLLHCNVGPRPGHAAYSPCTVEDLRRTGMDYWALGHVHRLEIVSELDPLVVYPGNLQGRSAHAGEQGAKGAILLDCDDSGVTVLDFVALDRVRFLDVEIDTTTLTDLPSLHAALTNHAVQLREAHAGRALILRPVLRGRSALHLDLQVSGGVDDLVRELRREADGHTPLLWWETPRDCTAPMLNRQAIVDRGDLSSELIARVDRLLGSTEDLGGVLARQADVLRKVGAARWLRLSDDDGPHSCEAILRDAEAVALSALERDRQ